ncbi:MerR family transcriptional regulator [Virgibacillus natechei]
MNEVKQKIGLSASTLRYYEKEHLIPEINRDSSGNRSYTDTDIEWISFIKTLRDTDMPIHLIKNYVSLFQEGSKTIATRKELIESHKEKVQKEVEQKLESLKVLQKKVKYYETVDRRKQRLSQRAFKKG